MLQLPMRMWLQKALALTVGCNAPPHDDNLARRVLRTWAVWSGEERAWCAISRPVASLILEAQTMLGLSNPTHVRGAKLLEF